jgi:quinolinate synthase
MKTINLENILESLWNKKVEVKVNPEVAIKAKQAIVKMIEL